MTVSLMYNFRELSDKFPTIFWCLIFHILHARLGYFFVAKREPKLFGFKYVTERGLKKILTFVIRYLRYFQENNTEALVNSKRLLKFP